MFNTGPSVFILNEHGIFQFYLRISENFHKKQPPAESLKLSAGGNSSIHHSSGANIGSQAGRRTGF